LNGLDTNIIVRYILRDEPRQTAAATRLIERECTKDHPGLVHPVVLCELVWVLAHGYGYPRKDIASVLRSLLTAEELRVADSETAWQALNDYEAGTGDYADYLIGHGNRTQGATRTLTFDRKAAGRAGMSLLKSS